MSLFSEADADESKRRQLKLKGWRQIESRSEPYAWWETSDGRRFTEEEAFALLEKMNKSEGK